MFSRLYIHIPCCLKKCHYCAFYSYPASETELSRISSLIMHEMELAASKYNGGPLHSIYFGGGTPSLLHPDFVKEMIDRATKLWGLSSTPEITLEVNPGTFTPGLFEQFFTSGINRLSVGVQSFNNANLTLLGRPHTAEETLEAFKNARRSGGFKSISIDLICGLPGQTLNNWRTELDQAILLNPDHISIYALSIEEGTRFEKLYSAANGFSQLPDQDQTADMLELTESLLCSKGFEHYEISNYARQGHRSEHNSGYWKRDGYLGLGPSAHSFFLSGWGLRLSNPSDTESWSRQILSGTLAHEEIQELTLEDALSEHIFLGLRRSDGISIEDSVNLFGKSQWSRHDDTFNSLIETGLLQRNAGRLYLTARGMMLSNQVFMRFV